jgi:hypothetical protein
VLCCCRTDSAEAAPSFGREGEVEDGCNKPYAMFYQFAEEFANQSLSSCNSLLRSAAAMAIVFGLSPVDVPQAKHEVWVRSKAFKF